MLEKIIRTDNSLRAGKQLDMAFLRLKIAFVITVSVSSLLVAALWPVVEHGILLSWLSAQAIVMAMRVVLLRRHARTKSDIALRKWKTEYTIGSAIAGLNWGVALFIFHVALLEPTTLLLILVIVGVGAYASVSMASLLPAAVAFLIPTLLPPSVWLFSFNYFLGVVALIYLGLMLLVTYQMHKVIRSAHLTTIENEAQKIALDESGQRMANYFENAPGFFFTLLRKPDGEVSMPFASTGITALFGLKPEALADSVSALAALYNPADREKVFAEMNRSGQSLTPCRVTFRANHPEKGEIWVEARSVPKQDADGNIRWNGFMQDITEQQQAAALLQKREREFRTLAENAPDPIYRYDRNCRRIYINKAVEQLTGVSLSKILGKSPTEAIPNPSVDAVKAEQAIRRVLDTGKPGELEVSLVAADGRDTTVHNLLVPEFADDGSVESVLCIGRDVTARKYMTDVLTKSERSFRTLAENATDNIARHDRHCRFVYLNPNFEKTLGLSTGFLLNKTPTEVFSDGVLDDYEETVKRVIASGQAADHYLLLPDTGDGERYHHIRITPEKNDSGEVSGVLSIGRDITGLKRYEQSLLMRAELERRQSEFFAVSPGMFVTLEHRGDGSYVMPFVSAGIRELYGLEPEAVMRDIGVLLARAHPDDNEMTFRKTEESERNLSPYHVEYRIIHPTKGVRWIECRAQPKRLQDGGTRWDGFYHDITERKQAEEDNHALQRQLQMIADNTPGAVNCYRMFMDGSGKMLYANKGMYDVFGFTLQDLADDITPMAYRMHPDDLPRAIEIMSDAARTLSTMKSEFRVNHPDKGEIWVQQISTPVYESENSMLWYGLMFDITERKRMEDMMRQREQEFRALAENSPDTIMRYDSECRRIYVNPAFIELIGLPAETLLGGTPTQYSSAPQALAYENALRRVLQSGEPGEHEYTWPAKEGKEIISHFRLIPEWGADGKLMSVLAVGRDISELNAHRKRIYQMAFYDTLTTLPNRALFNDRMKQMLGDAAWHGQQAGVMLLDLDRFKAVNDTLGHAAGDELLREAAGRLVYCVRGYDTVARLSGDEFAILLPEVRSGDDLGRIASKILEAFNEPFVLEGHEMFISCSIGIAVYPSDGANAEDLLKQADSAMYFAKRSGRNTFRFFSSELMVSANERLTLEADLRRGFARGELELYYQPKVSLSDGAVIGSEALLRWHHPQRGMVPPDKFIPIAEDCGLIVEIGEWVLRNACRTACEWNGAGKPLHKVAINLSARQFQSVSLVETVRRLLAETACQPDWIELEITESLLLDEAGAVLEMLGAFREMGITIAIDDFGTGYSSLSYLARFPIDTLKIDRSFTSRITQQNHHAELVKAIISIARSLNQTVVAEGVETAEEAAFLREHGCLIAQGYLYSRPVTKTVFEMLPLSFGHVEAIA